MTPEGLIKAALIARFKKIGRFYLRLQSGKVKVMGGWMQLCPAGTYDFLTFDDRGGCLWIETKRLKGKLRDAQIEFRDRVTAMGHTCIELYSVEDVAAAFQEAA